MPDGLAALLFAGSLVLSALASLVLAKRLDQAGTYLGASAGLTGLLTALAADTPEIASAIFALATGRHDLGLGVIFGSNIFNIAALLGVGVLAAGPISCPRRTLALSAGATLAVTAIVAAQRMYGLSAAATGALLAAVMVPYVAVVALKPSHLARLRLPRAVADALGPAHPETAVKTQATAAPPPWADMTAIVPLLAAIVVTSLGLVSAASTLGGRWGWSDLTVGALVIASLTGLPNLVTALRLASQGRGAAVVSETYDSNSLNLIFGAFLPTIFLPPAVLSQAGMMALWWMAGTTVLSAGLILRAGRLGRLGGVALVASWVGFAAIVVIR